jgi:hypothetical protein
MTPNKLKNFYKWISRNNMTFSITFHGYSLQEDKKADYLCRAQLIYNNENKLLIRPNLKENIVNKGISGFGTTPDLALIGLIDYLKNKSIVFTEYERHLPQEQRTPELLIPDFDLDIL